jgi:hypothetical protein
MFLRDNSNLWKPIHIYGNVLSIGHVNLFENVQLFCILWSLEVRKKTKASHHEKFKIVLGKRIATLILEKGYKSPYEFWLEHGGDGLSRSNLNYILNGKGDPKITTLKIISEGLGIELADLFRND